MHSLKKVLFAATLGVALSGSALAANEVKNAQFNNGTLTSSGMDFNKWTEYGSVSAFTTGASNSWAALSYTSNVASQITQAVSLTAGWYSISFDYFLKSSNSASLIASLFHLNSMTSMGATSYTGNSASTTSGTFGVTQYLNAGTYLIGFSGIKSRVDDVSIVATVAPTPGPIAGAGLPVVLGLMGFAAWRRRQTA